MADNLIVFAADQNVWDAAWQLSRKLGIPVTRNREEALERGLMLQLDGSGLSLTDGDLVLQGDFTRMLPRLRKNNLQQEMLVKAARIRNSKNTHELTAVDMTAGMGEDSLLLAAAGFSVDLYEYNPVIAALLQDTLCRAGELSAAANTSDTIYASEVASAVSRMHLHCSDSIRAVQTMRYRPDVIVLDPMFPERQKSALVKKKFQLLQQLESPCSDEEELLRAAVAARPHKIVIKRPLKGPFLAGMKPSYSLTGKAIRYDCLVFA